MTTLADIDTPLETGGSPTTQEGIDASMYRNRRVLVAGGTGTIGIPMVKLLADMGADITVVSLDSLDYAAVVIGGMARFVRADLTDLDTCLEATRGQDYVINLVGIKGSTGIGTTQAASYFVPMLRYQTNLMDAAFQSEVSRYLFVSSICAYPPAEVHEEDNMWRGLPVQNDRYAGIAKRVGEIQAETYREQYGWDAVRIVRPSNVYGPFDDFNPTTAQVIPALIARIIGGENPLKVWGDASTRRDFIFSEEVAAGMLIALADAPAGLPINLGSGVGVEIRQLVDTILDHVLFRPDVQWDTSAPTGDSVRIMSVVRAMKTIGFQTRVSLDEGIHRTVEWFLDHPDWAARKVGAHYV